MKNNWYRKDWKESARLIDEMVDLEVFQEKDINNIRRFLRNWLRYFNDHNDKQSSDSVRLYLKQFDS